MIPGDACTLDLLLLFYVSNKLRFPALMLVIPGTEPKHLRTVLQLRLVFRNVRQGGCSGHMYGYM